MQAEFYGISEQVEQSWLASLTSVYEGVFDECCWASDSSYFFILEEYIWKENFSSL